MFKGEVVSIHIAPDEGEPVVEVDQVRAIEGRGLEGDRYFIKSGKMSRKDDPGREVTLIEAEAVEALARDYGVELSPGESRRNIMVRGVALNHLRGVEFQVGDAVLRGVKLCEPCGYLEGLTKEGIRAGLKHRGGLNAEIVTGGLIRPGDEVSRL
ncbi:MAG TPA: MOSC domain-containing protein [Actinomycetota bacterium]|jgi:MOSC domain-containing protein YiiM|nr:MOSC domain-containing protein [Actinomycetota bacterium]